MSSDSAKGSSKNAYGKTQEETRTIYLNDSLRNVQFNYTTNYIRTTKFTKWSFFPLCLLQQFKRFANVYFLVIAIIQSISIISPLNPATAVAPLVFVIAVSMIREAIEDYIRYKADKGKFYMIGIYRISLAPLFLMNIIY